MANNSIVIKGRGIQKEGQAAAAVSPGHLVARNSTGGIIPHGTAGGHAARAFAKELEVFGRGIDTDYAQDDTVIYEVFPQGAEVRAKLAASAAAVTRGGLLESAGNGTLRVHDTGQPVAIALESVDNSAGGSPVFIHVEVL